MTIEELKSLKTQRVSQEIAKRVKNRWDSIAKPLDSMGRFEDIFCKIGAIQGREEIDISKKAVIVMCADNGIVREGVSQSGQEVTRICAQNMAEGTTSVCRMAEPLGAKILPVDIGIAGEPLTGVRNMRVRPGTEDFLEKPAMTEEECLSAIEVGIGLVGELKDEGYNIVGTGEMGIGNTSTSSAMSAAILGLSAEEVTGRGAGLDDERLKKKKKVINDALEKYSFSSDTDAFEILRTLGGLDIAGLCGVCIGGAKYHLPVVLDGLISGVAALTAQRILPGIGDFLIASHLSREKAAIKIMEELSLKPVIDADMALGEGTGAVMMMALLDIAARVYNSERHFSDINIEQYKRY